MEEPEIMPNFMGCQLHDAIAGCEVAGHHVGHRSIKESAGRIEAAPSAGESCPTAAENIRKDKEYSGVVIEIDSVCHRGGNRIIRYRARDIAARVRSGKC